MRKALHICWLVAGLTFASPSLLYAEDLLEIYHQALTADPTFKKAKADWLSAKLNFPIALTGTGSPGSGLFPYVDVSGFINRTFEKEKIGSRLVGSGHFTASDYAVTITQPIFNYATWKAISRANFQVKAATATYIAAAQDLMFRTAQIYFNVLRDYDVLQVIEQKKIAILQQLVVAKKRLQIGIDAVTDVYDVKSRYYRALTDEITARRDLDDQLENLRAITGRSYQALKDAPEKIPLVIPKPSNIDRWVQISEKQNYEIQSNLYTMLSAREKIKETAAANWPTVNAQGNFETFQETQRDGDVPLQGTYLRTSELGVTIDFPIFQGGHVLATTRQDEYNYLSASDQLEFTRYEVRKNARQAFINIDYGIDQIKTGFKSINASKDNLKATEISYIIGTRNMVDVLGDLEQVYFVMERWVNDRYDYLISLVRLKQAAGTLAPKDLKILNSWLSETISLKGMKKPTDQSHIRKLSKETRMKLKLLDLQKMRHQLKRKHPTLPRRSSTSPPSGVENIKPDTSKPTEPVFKPPAPLDYSNPTSPKIEKPPVPPNSRLLLPKPLASKIAMLPSPNKIKKNKPIKPHQQNKKQRVTPKKPKLASLPSPNKIKKNKPIKPYQQNKKQRSMRKKLKYAKRKSIKQHRAKHIKTSPQSHLIVQLIKPIQPKPIKQEAIKQTIYTPTKSVLKVKPTLAKHNPSKHTKIKQTISHHKKLAKHSHKKKPLNVESLDSIDLPEPNLTT